MRRAGLVVAEVLERVGAAARPGVTTAALAGVASEVLARRGAGANFTHCDGFPAPICTSLNSVLAYGLPDDRRLREGDLLSVDCGATVEGYHADAATTLPIGAVSPEAKRLVEAADDALWAGLSQVAHGRPLHLVGRAVEGVVQRAGMGVVREYGGHAIGTALHERPPVPSYWPGTPGPTMKMGMVLAIEPMVTAGSPLTHVLEDGWGVVTTDGSLAAHVGHNVALTEDGPAILTLPA